MSQRFIQIPARVAEGLGFPQASDALVGLQTTPHLIAPHIAAAALRAEREARERALLHAPSALHVSDLYPDDDTDLPER
ncbi:hypothetical protein [Marinovum sp.]|uniref:hypothetical protein n=1 Tax=Marinovum sp. TaxID=2024839 RepID=UPI003A959ADE